MNAHFGVDSVDALTVAQVKEAIQWVQRKIDALPGRLAMQLPTAERCPACAPAPSSMFVASPSRLGSWRNWMPLRIVSRY